MHAGSFDMRGCAIRSSGMSLILRCCPLQGVATCHFGNRTAQVEGGRVSEALAALSAGKCTQLNLQHTAMSLCGCNVYETQLLTAAQVRSLKTALCASWADKCILDCEREYGSFVFCDVLADIIASARDLIMLRATCRTEHVSCSVR